MPSPERPAAMPRQNPSGTLLTALFMVGFTPAASHVIRMSWISNELQRLAATCPSADLVPVWILAEPGLVIQRTVAAIGAHTDRLVPLAVTVSVLVAAVILTSIALTGTTDYRRRPALALLAGAAGISPLFFIPALTAAPWFWGAAVWYAAMRALCRVEIQNNVQMEMGLGSTLAILVLVEPAATGMVLLTALLLPAVLLRQTGRSSLSAYALILGVPALVLVAQLAAHLMHGQSVLDTASQWTGGRALLPEFVVSGTLPAPLDRITGFLPGILSPAVLLTPLLPLVAYAAMGRSGTRHLASLLIIVSVPLIVGSLISWRLGAPSYGPWLLYLLMGQVAWYAETTRVRQGGIWPVLVFLGWSLLVLATVFFSR